MKPSFLVLAAIVLAITAWRWRHESVLRRVLGFVVAVGLIAYGLEFFALPNFEKLIEGVGSRLGSWTYLLVGALAFLETGGFIGLVAPGETAVLVGGLVAGQGKISVVILIGVVWACAVAGDLVSYTLGRRLGREFIVKHGPRLKITEARLAEVERFFERHGGKAILIGRFVGLVRAIAPFLAGSSRMPLRRFLPYDVVGAGLWGTTFVLLGYIFWQSFDQVVAAAKRGATLLAIVISLSVAAVAAYRYLREPGNRATARAWLAEQAQRPALAPFARGAGSFWNRVGAPIARRAAGPARFAWHRLTPGQLGLELTALLAIVLVGVFAFGAYAAAIGTGPAGADREAFSIARGLGSGTAVDVARLVTRLGTFPVVGAVTAITMLALFARRRLLEGLALGSGLALTTLAVHAAKGVSDRPRPLHALVGTAGSSFPSGHAANAVAFIAVALALRYTVPRLAEQAALVVVALVVALAVCASRVELRAHYLSDVLAGAGLSAAIFALCAMTALIIGFVRQNEPGDSS